MLFYIRFDLKVALKRQQAVEDAIALRLASNETGKSFESLPPGKIFGMSVTEPCATPPASSPVDLQPAKPSNFHSIKPKTYRFSTIIYYACCRRIVVERTLSRHRLF